MKGKLALHPGLAVDLGKLAMHRRLGIQMGAAVALLVGLGFGIVGGFVVNRERETLTREFSLRLLTEARSLSVAVSSPLLRRDPELELHPLVLKSLADTPDLVDVVVLDSKGNIQGHHDLHRVGDAWARAADSRADSLPNARPGEVVRNERDAIVLELPVRHLDQPIGTLVVRASRESVEQAVRESRRHLVVLGGLATGMAILAVLALVSIGLRPLDELRRGVLQLGSGDLDTRVRVRSDNELGLLGNLLNRMAEGLQKAQATLVHKERLDREIEIAFELQNMLLPRTTTALPGYDLETRYVPALEVSGDYYDVIPLGNDRVLFVTADVSGKGVPGLVVMAMLRTLLHSLARPGMELVETLLAANTMLRGVMKKTMFVTCHAGILELKTGVYRYSSAGHCPPVRFGVNDIEVLFAGGKPLGMFPEAILAKSLTERSARLAPGDGLLLYTDGLVEAFDANGQPMGMEAVLEPLRRASIALRAEPRPGAPGPHPGAPGQHAGAPGPHPAARLVEQLLQRMQAHTGERDASDDLTLILLWRERTAAAVPTGVRA